MIRGIIMLSIAFTLALLAGAALGILATAHPPDQTQHPDASWLGEKLNLTPAQNSEMQTIWDKADDQTHKAVQERQKLQQEWDQQVYSLLTPEQKVKYQELRRNFAKRAEDIDGQTRKAFDDANIATRQVLSPQQRAAFDALVAQKRFDGGAGNNATAPGVGLPGAKPTTGSDTVAPMAR